MNTIYFPEFLFTFYYLPFRTEVQGHNQLHFFLQPSCFYLHNGCLVTLPLTSLSYVTSVVVFCGCMFPLVMLALSCIPLASITFSQTSNHWTVEVLYCSVDAKCMFNTHSQFAAVCHCYLHYVNVFFHGINHKLN